MHFSESTEMEIPQERFEEAASLLRKLEGSVIRLVNQTGRNTLYPVGERLVSDVRLSMPKGRSNAEVMGFLLPEMEFQEAENMLKMLVSAKRLLFDGMTYKTND